MRIAVPSLSLTLVVLAGCGMEAVDLTMRTRGSVGVPDDMAIKVSSEPEFVCPNVVAANGRPFSAKDVARGDLEGAFGPFVPCNTVVQAGKGTCATCNQPYRTPGNDGDEPLAFPRFTSPFSGETVDPVALKVMGGEDPRNPDRLAQNYDPKAKRYFEVVPGDVVTVIDFHEEVVSPKGTPFDPTDNGVRETGGDAVVHVVDGFEGVCWRCGGTAFVQETAGNGTEFFAVFGVDTVKCPECDGDGFCTYEGGLPPTYRAWVKQGQAYQTVPDRKWQHPKVEAGSAPPAGEPSGGEPSGDGQ